MAAAVAMIILGVDPGSARTGYGIIQTDGRRHALLAKGVITPFPRAPLPDRLRAVYRGVVALLESHRPDLLAVEDCFHAVNTRTALVLGHVRGVVLLAGAEAGIPIHEFPPATVKAQITGFGRAEKQQVALMVSRLLNLPTDLEPGDAADALAVALCLSHLSTSPGRPA